jgi:hypothetical protein
MASQAFSLYLPFRLSDGKDINPPLPQKAELGDLTIELKENPPFYAVVLSNIPSRQEAHDLLGTFISGLYWVAIENQFGILVRDELQPEYYPPDPVQAHQNYFGKASVGKVDVAIDGGTPAIYPTESQVAILTGQDANVIISLNPTNIVRQLIDEIRISRKRTALSAKLKLGIQLYSLSYFRSYDFARFLVLCVVLETLAPEPILVGPSVNLIDKWIKEAKECSANIQNDDSASAELMSLASRLTFLRRRSHRSRIRQYVKAMLEKDGVADADKLGRAAAILYDTRSALTHTGSYELGDDLSRLDEIVRLTLKAAIRQPE